MKPAAPGTLRRNLLCAGGLLLAGLSAPFPSLQAAFHAALVVALIPVPGASLPAALWAVATGWVVETTLRLPPHLGGTAWADLTVVLLAGWTSSRWPLDGFKDWMGRLAGFALLQVLLVHAMVRMAAGPHPWGWGWLWAFLTLPLWGWGAWRLLHPGASRAWR